MTYSKKPHLRRVREASLAAAVTLIASAIARGQSTFDQIGLTQLLDDPAYMGIPFDGTGVEVGQVEALIPLTIDFEVSPSIVGQPTNFFTYTNNGGTVSYTFNPSLVSGHADIVGSIFYGT